MTSRRGLVRFQLGLAALGEDLLKLADCTEGRTSWLALLTRLQRLSG
ncbi:hypothetical protein AAKU55_005525 [Oxalobacteraceae bacterium GrIS 1.11]